MDSKQIDEIAKNGLFDLGIHTVTHPALSFHTKQYQLNEIGECKSYLENLNGNFVNAIAYPYGRWNDTTVQVLKEESIEAGFTTQGYSVNKNSDRYKMGRFQVNDWDGELFKKHLKLWSSSY